MKENPTLLSANALSKKFLSYKKEPGLLGSVKSLFKREYQEKTAVDNFSLEIRRGEIVGLLGPNGAGKTTLMKMFTGIIVPTSGSLKILGSNPWQREKSFRKKIALVMGQKSQLWWDIPAMDSFELLQKYYEIPRPDFNRRIQQMSRDLEVEPLLHIHVRKLSLGERMKMELMASLLHNPDIIFLDEPTIGLDLVAQEKIREFIKSYRQQTNCSVLITSHYMADVEELCQRLVLIFDGQNRFDGPLWRFSNIFGQEKKVSFHFSIPVTRPPRWLDELEPLWNDDKTFVELRMPESSIRKNTLVILKHFPVVAFNTEKMPIERIMRTVIKNPELLRNQQHAQS